MLRLKEWLENRGCRDVFVDFHEGTLTAYAVLNTKLTYDFLQRLEAFVVREYPVFWAEVDWRSDGLELVIIASRGEDEFAE